MIYNFSSLFFLLQVILDTLIVPFGDKLKGKKDITQYLCFTEGEVLNHSWLDASIEEVEKKGKKVILEGEA